MTIRYVGSGGNDANSGLSWALRKLTLNGVEDTPVAAGDTVYVGAGTYRELLTVDVSGTADNPISYIGDYRGANTDGVGGVVRITGSDDDKSATRANCITDGAAARNYRTFAGFQLDTTTNDSLVKLSGGGTNTTIYNCIFLPSGSGSIRLSGTGTNHAVYSCLLWHTQGSGMLVSHSATVSASGIAIYNNTILSGASGILITRVGGITIKNNTFVGRMGRCIYIDTALAGGQTLTVYDNTFYACASTAAITITADGELVEDYNAFYGNAANITGGTPPAIGAHSVAYPLLPDTRWFFEMVNGGRLVTPFDLASYSQLIDLAGTSPSAADMRGTGTVGAQREWGALEYDATLLNAATTRYVMIKH